MRRLVLVACLLALLVPLAGCGVFADGPPPSDERAVDAVETANASVADVETYRFDLAMHVTASNADRTRSVRVDGNGSVDVRERLMHAVVHAEGNTLHSYVTSEHAYQECAPPWHGYAVENVSETGRWATVAPLHRQLALLDRTNVYWQGNRTLDGNRTVLVTASPSAATLTSFVENRQTDSVDLQSGGFENATVRLWLDPETDRPVKFELRLRLSRGETTATATLTTHYRDYGAPVSVTVPSNVTDPETQYDLGCPAS
ncbi:hypothetical protein [Halarchaeum sp. P4]|uniref:hypothetical protein n=1 Tax=Halarchaeum sp. P4 TaxID=3421639 RepID=UPI003EB8E095